MKLFPSYCFYIEFKKEDEKLQVDRSGHFVVKGERQISHKIDGKFD